MKIACVLVTFNRKEMLLECLDALLLQTAPLQTIYLIDNNSSDGTHELLVSRGYLENPKIRYFNTGANLGGAGGFSFGMKKAFASSYDWYWLMDDDVEPYPDALEKQLSLSNMSQCIHPQKVFKDGSTYQWDGWFNPRTLRTKWQPNERFSNGVECVEVNYGCFEGMLIHHSIVEKIGVPDERFFIHSDDLIYGYLASLHTKVLYTNRAKFLKKIKKDQTTRFLGRNIPYLSGFNQYFNLRNHALLIDQLTQAKKTSYVLSRSLYLLKFFKIFTTSLFVHKNFKDAKMAWWGFLDGLKRNFKGHKRFLN